MRWRGTQPRCVAGMAVTAVVLAARAWSRQAVGGFLPLQNGTIVFYTNRTSTDQVAGFAAAAKRAIGDHMMASDLAQTFQRLRGDG